MKTAVVTGAGKGLGRRIAHGLAGKGFEVLVTDVDEDAANATAASVGGGAWAMHQDVRDPDSHRRVAAAAAARGPLEVWINNAGVLSLGPIWDLNDDTVRRHVEVNVLGVMWGSRAAIEAMRSEGGHIINVASISSLVPAPGLAVYGATKNAVLSYSVSIEGDLRRAGVPVHVSAVCPDAIDTDMVRDVAHSSEAGLIFSAKSLLTAEEVAAVVLEVVENPKLMVSVPRSRALLAHLLRPFPGLGLRALEPFRKLGERRLKAMQK
ncbi:MAG: SDR family NAD(P)-dependent oxidoreductase [Polyangiales bacterium]